MTRFRAFALFALLALAATILAACGDDDAPGDSGDAQAVLEETFTNDQSIDSANIDFTIQAAVEGDESNSVDLRVTGPVGSSEDRIEGRLDIAGTVASAGVDESIDIALTLTGGKGYVEYDGSAYALDKQTQDAIDSQLDEAAGAMDTAGSIAEPDSEGETSLKQSCEQALSQFGGDTSVCDFTLYDFLTNLAIEGEEDIGGVAATHVSGDIDVGAVVSTISDIVAQTPAALFLGPDTLSGFEDAVSEAHFAVYSGADDRLLRGLDLSITATVPPEFATLAGFQGVTEDASLRLTEVNEPVSVEAPANPRPIGELYKELGLKPGDLDGLGIPGFGGPDADGGLGMPDLQLPGLSG